VLHYLSGSSANWTLKIDIHSGPGELPV